MIFFIAIFAVPIVIYAIMASYIVIGLLRELNDKVHGPLKVGPEKDPLAKEAPLKDPLAKVGPEKDGPRKDALMKDALMKEIPGKERPLKGVQVKAVVFSIMSAIYEFYPYIIFLITTEYAGHKS